MSKENRHECCCKELAEKLVASGKDNERLAKINQSLKQENERLQTELQNNPLTSTSLRPGTTGEEAGYKGKFKALLEINRVWKKDYDKLHGKFETLNGERKLLEAEEKKSKACIEELEKRQKLLESELARLAAILCVGRDCNGRQSPSERRCEMAKSQMHVCNEDFERERRDRGVEKEIYRFKLQDIEELLRTYTALCAPHTCFKL